MINIVEIGAGLRALVVAKLHGGLFNRYTLPEEDGTLATLDGTETMTRKTLTAPEINDPTTTSGVGAANGATVTAVEQGGGVVHKTVLTLAATPISVADANAYGSTKVYDFPEGRIAVIGVTSSLQFAVTSARAGTINDNASLTWAVGSAAASNATLSGTMVDMIPKTTKVLSAATTALNTASTAALAASAQFNGTGTAVDANLNVGFETGTDIDADGTLTATGTITITWINLGDY